MRYSQLVTICWSDGAPGGSNATAVISMPSGNSADSSDGSASISTSRLRAGSSSMSRYSPSDSNPVDNARPNDSLACGENPWL
jgi:hypothetical protein